MTEDTTSNDIKICSQQRDPKTGRFLKVVGVRFCYACGKNKTFINKRGIAIWHNNLPIGWLCVNCYHAVIRKGYRDEYNKYRFRYKDKQIYVGRPVREGRCSRCGMIGKKTGRHHYAYIACMPWACTEEFCSACHGKETISLGQVVLRKGSDGRLKFSSPLGQE